MRQADHPPSPSTGLPPTVLDVQGITRRFGDFTAVDHVSFSIPEGCVFGLVGLNGAGKSTLIKMLITLVRPTEGTASICGADIIGEPALVRTTIGYVPQLVSADGDLTAYENLRLYARLYDVPAADRHGRILEALKFMDLSEVADRLVRHFSGGMVRRLEIAQSMLHRPRLLFLDEPTVGLDPVARASVWKHIIELRDRYGTTIFLTTHLLEEVEELCEVIGIMTSGKLVAFGPIGQVKASVGPDATIEDTFLHYAQVTKEDVEGGFSAANQARRTARRLG